MKNAHGDVVGMVDSGNNLIQEYRYDAFGNQIGRDENDTNPFRYSGEYWDGETENIYLRARMYDPGSGRFTSEDPIQSGSNWYIYCSGNPINRWDTLGLADSPIPGWLDWNRDGFIDTEQDKKRFDANNNHIADWIEAGYATEDEWYQSMTSNILKDFPYVSQGQTNLCWAADISMVTEWFTGNSINYIDIAKQEYGETNYDVGYGGPVSIARCMIKNGYLNGSGYAVDGNSFNGGSIYNTFQYPNENPLTFEVIVKNINHGLPFIISTSVDHVEVIIGYVYDESSGRQQVICMDSAGSMKIHNFEDIKNSSAITFKRENV